MRGSELLRTTLGLQIGVLLLVLLSGCSFQQLGVIATSQPCASSALVGMEVLNARNKAQRLEQEAHIKRLLAHQAESRARSAQLTNGGIGSDAHKKALARSAESRARIARLNAEDAERKARAARLDAHQAERKSRRAGSDEHDCHNV